MVLVLSRGGFCPKDRRQAEGLVELHRKIEPGLVIYKIYIGYWFFGRPTLEDLRQDLRAVTKKCRPDWDITTPELSVNRIRTGSRRSDFPERPLGVVNSL